MTIDEEIQLKQKAQEYYEKDLSYNQVYKQGVIDGYNKAIDDFAEMVCEKVESFTTVISGIKADVLTLDYLTEFVFEIAEQLKG